MQPRKALACTTLQYAKRLRNIQQRYVLIGTGTTPIRQNRFYKVTQHFAIQGMLGMSLWQQQGSNLQRRFFAPLLYHWATLPKEKNAPKHRYKQVRRMSELPDYRLGAPALRREAQKGRAALYNYSTTKIRQKSELSRLLPFFFDWMFLMRSCFW